MFGWTVWGCLVWGVGRGGGQSCISTLLAAKLFDIFFSEWVWNKSTGQTQHRANTHTYPHCAHTVFSLGKTHNTWTPAYLTEANEVCAWKLLSVPRSHVPCEHSFQLKSDKEKSTLQHSQHRFNLFSINFAFHCFWAPLRTLCLFALHCLHCSFSTVKTQREEAKNLKRHLRVLNSAPCFLMCCLVSSL